MVVAPGLMLDNILPIPGAESLPFLPFGIQASPVCGLDRKAAGGVLFLPRLAPAPRSTLGLEWALEGVHI